MGFFQNCTKPMETASYESLAEQQNKLNPDQGNVGPDQGDPTPTPQICGPACMAVIFD